MRWTLLICAGLAVFGMNLHHQSQTSDQKESNAELFSLTISSKVWKLLDTKAEVISNAVKAIKVPEFSGEKSLTKYHIWNGKIDSFVLNSNGAFFEILHNGFRIRINGARLTAFAKGKVEVGTSLLGSWFSLAIMNGGIKIKSKKVDLDAKFVWNDFQFVPIVSMHSNIKLSFTGTFRILAVVKEIIQKKVALKIETEMGKKLSEVVEKKLNPHLLQLKRKMISIGIQNYHVEWMVHNNSLHVAFTPKRKNNVLSWPKPINEMACLSVNILYLLHALSSRFRRSTAKTVDVTCVAPKLSCQGTSCYVCSDFDIRSYSNSSADKFHNCLPPV